MTAVAPQKTPSWNVEVVNFDYSVVTPAVAEALRKQSLRIRGRVQSTVAAIIEIGNDLIAVKQHLDHGLFCNWVEVECGFSLRSAQRYIRAAEFAHGKSATVSLLDPSTVYLLSSVTKEFPEVIDQVMALAGAGTVIDHTGVKNLVGEARDKKRELEREAKLVPRQRKARDKRRREAEALRLKCDREKAEQQASRERIAEALLAEIGADAFEAVCGALEAEECRSDLFAFVDVMKAKNKTSQGRNARPIRAAQDYDARAGFACCVEAVPGTAP